MKREPAAVVLAAGASSRFRGAKLLAVLGGSSLVERAVDAVPSSRVRATIVVVGHDSLAVRGAIGARRGVEVVLNPGYRAGMAGSIRAGVRAVPAGSSGALILLADQPFVSRRLLARVLDAFEARGSRGIVACSSGGVVGPPAVFARSYFHELERLRGDRGARAVLRRHRSDVTLVRARGRTLADVDTREDLESLAETREPGE